MKTNAPNSENFEVRSEKGNQDSSFSPPNSHFSPHPPVLVPKLRFPEFRGAWEKKTLETLGYFTGGGTPSKDNAAYWTGEIPWISSSDLNEDSISQINITRFITKQAVQESATKLVPANSILLISRVGVGKLAVSTFPLCTSQDFTNFTPTDADPLFLAYLLKSQKETLLSFNQGTSIKGFTKDNIASLRLGLPSPAEQQKIAECLSSVDELIAAQARKVDALKTHKKGLMQQLFPREGETQPRLRFPEFQNAGEWGEGRLADIATVLQGYGFPERHQGQTSGDYPFYKVSDISRSLAAGKLFIQESANYVNESLLKELRAKPIPEGTTIFAKIGEAIRSNKRAITTVPCLIDNNAAGVKRIKGRSTDFFIYLLMEQISLIDHAGGVVPAVNKSAIEEISVRFPEPAEQERIASCLASLDALITAETQKLEALKTHKRGLMQQLFPQETGSENLELRSEK